MPVYDFKCLGCGQVSEVFLKTAAGAPCCPHCGSSEMDKLVSAPAAILNGKTRGKGTTCCGSEERCDSPPCSSGDGCRRD